MAGNSNQNEPKKTLQQLRSDVFNAFATKVAQGDIYKNNVPKLEKGLQYDLYLYLKEEKGYDVVYEMELPNLGQYLPKEPKDINEDKIFSHEEDSLVPDLVVKLGEDGFACFELKYNETDKTLYDHDGDKCKVYVEHCSDVHYAGFIDLLKGKIDGYKANDCKDPSYKFHYCYWHDNIVDSDHALNKEGNAYSVKEFWKKKLEIIKRGEAEFSKYEDINYVRKMK